MWPFHDYGAAAWDTSGTGAASPYTTDMYTQWIARAANDGMEFATMDDLAQRMAAFNGDVVIDIAAMGSNTVVIHAAKVVSEVGDVLTLDLGAWIA